MCPRCCLPYPWAFPSAITHGLGERGISWLRLIGAGKSVQMNFKAPPIDTIIEGGLRGEEGYSKYHLDGFNITASWRADGFVLYRLLGQNQGGMSLSSANYTGLPGAGGPEDGYAQGVMGTVKQKSLRFSLPGETGGPFYDEKEYELEATGYLRISIGIDYDACTQNRIALYAVGKPYLIEQKWTLEGEPTGAPFYRYDTGGSEAYEIQRDEDSTPIISGVVGTANAGYFVAGGRAFSKLVR